MVFVFFLKANKPDIFLHIAALVILAFGICIML